MNRTNRETCLAVVVTLAMALLTDGTHGFADEKATVEPGKQQPQKLERTVKVELQYLLYLPKDYAQGESWPLLLFLHGAGEKGTDLERVKIHGPPKLIAGGKEFPFIVVSPQCPSNQSWQAHELGVLLDDIVEKYKVDQDRIYVTGLSMGGFGTWSLGSFSPDRFAALVPICGGGDPKIARRFARSGVAVWIFHGAKDRGVPVAFAEEMAEALKKENASVKLTIYPDAEHDSWTQTYNDPELYTWLLQQKRKPRAR